MGSEAHSVSVEATSEGGQDNQVLVFFKFSGLREAQTIIIVFGFYCENNLGFFLAHDLGMSQACFGQKLVTMQTGAESG